MPLVGLDIARYKPARPLSHYADLGISDTGSVRSVKFLSDDVVQYLQDSGVNSALWDGNKGLFGREYVSNRAPFSAPKDRQALYQRYLDLRRGLPSHKTLQQLHNNLEIQMRTQRQITTSVHDIEQELEQLRKAQQLCAREEGEDSERVRELTQQIRRLESDCAASKSAADKIQNKVKQSRTQTSESETGCLRRVALLRSLVNSMNKDERPNDRTKADMNEFRRLAREADEKSSRTCMDYMQIRRVYIDAKTGIMHLYNLESILKGMLEHLEVYMRSSSVPFMESESQVTFAHKGYVRRQWTLATSNFGTTLPFVKSTSLLSARGIVQEQLQNHDRNSSDSGTHETGVFKENPRLLPSYLRIRLRHLFNKKSLTIHLHKDAAKAYKEINLLYDVHERTVKEALEVLQQKEVENRRAHDDLIVRWESLLGIQND